MFKKGVNFRDLVDIGDLVATDKDFVLRNGQLGTTIQTAKNKLFRKIPAGSRSVTLPAVLTAADNDKTIIITDGSGSLSVDNTIVDGFLCSVTNKSNSSATFSTTSGAISEITGLLAIPAGGSANILMAANSVMAISSISAPTNNSVTGPTASTGNNSTAATAATSANPASYPSFIFASGAETYDTVSPCFGSASWNSQGYGSATIDLGSNNNNFCISLWVRATAGKNDFTGAWLALVDANSNSLGIYTYNIGLCATSLNASTQATNKGSSDANVYDGNWHKVTMNYDGSQLCVLVDGGYHASVANGPFIGGVCRLDMYGSCGPSGTGIDGVKISKVSKYPYNSPTYPANQIAPVRETNDVVIWQFDGNGLGT